MHKKILLIRLDKIGDLICTLCVDQVSFLKDYEVQWVIDKGLGFIPDNADPVRNYLEISKKNWQESLKALRQFLKAYRPDVAVSFQAPWWVHYALWLENVPLRAGVLSQWHSFLFLNKGLRQKRSQALKHEADYNLDLLRHALNVPSHETVTTPILKLKAPETAGLLERFELQEGAYDVVHPGMAGSALNWPLANYIELIEQITQDSRVVLTGTSMDEPWLKDIKAHFQNNPRVLVLQNKLNTRELLVILKNAHAVIVPSTGVAHIAASLGAPVLGLYSPLKVQHPRRWAARGEKVHIFLPPNAESLINGEDMSCMKDIPVAEVLSVLKEI